MLSGKRFSAFFQRLEGIRIPAQFHLGANPQFPPGFGKIPVLNRLPGQGHALGVFARVKQILGFINVRGEDLGNKNEEAKQTGQEPAAWEIKRISTVGRERGE